MARHHRSARLAATATALLLLVGCAPGPVADPAYVTDSPAGGDGADVAAPPTDGPPAWEAPGDDLAWSECTARLFSDAGVVPPGGVRLQCASFDAPLDPIDGATGTVSIGVVRALSARTPADAPPLVLTTGSDLATSALLPRWLARDGADLLAGHPIVAVDRRGMGRSGALQCVDPADAAQLRDQAQGSSDDPVAALGGVALRATTACTDAIAPGDSAYDTSRAAEDLEKLRTLWGVPALAVMGIGNGAQVALAYAGLHPSKVARLVLDSPIVPAVAAEAAAEARVKGQQAAFDAFVAQCSSLPVCALGPDPRGAVDALLADTRAGSGPDGVSTAALTDAISTALGWPSGDRVGTTTALATALARARDGDPNALTGYLNTAEALRDTDGRFVNACSDALDRPTPDRVRELVVAWGRAYPEFGTVAALDLVRCLNWPSGTVPQAPGGLKVDVMVLGVGNDPVVGADGVAATAATVINAGAASRRLMWQGTGHGAAVYSGCAVPVLLGYLAEGALPPTDTFCPA